MALHPLPSSAFCTLAAQTPALAPIQLFHPMRLSVMQERYLLDQEQKHQQQLAAARPSTAGHAGGRVSKLTFPGSRPALKPSSLQDMFRSSYQLALLQQPWWRAAPAGAAAAAAPAAPYAATASGHGLAASMYSQTDRQLLFARSSPRRRDNDTAMRCCPC